MTNHWADIGNSTCVVVWGANPAENHPACIAHVGRARFPQQFFAASDPRSSKKAAQMIVIDPRKTRTALLCDELNTSKPAAERDKYVRIRPGTDIALVNGLVRYIIETMEAGHSASAGFFNHLNETSNGSFYTDGANSVPTAVTNEALTLTGTMPLANRNISATASVYYTSGYPASGALIPASGYVLNSGSGTLARAAVTTIPSGAAVTVDYSYGGYSALNTAVSGSSKYTDARFLIAATSGAADYQRTTYASGAANQITNFPAKATTVSGDPNTVYNRLKKHVAPYTLAVVADICGCSTADITFIADAFIANSKCSNGVNANGTPSIKDARDPAFRVVTMLYAMGITQHTCGSQNIKGFALLQTLMGNMGRQGGGINALRGIHNVQGSTDMGLLNGNIPAYSNNPTVQTDGGPVWATSGASTSGGFAKYMDALWGTPLNGTGNKTTMDASYDDAYTTGAMGLQQRGFYNMSLKWFGDYATTNLKTSLSARRPDVDAAYSLWPKGNGHDHITMFRAMTSGVTTAAIVWGQNPAITEPNQGAVRTGLSNLDLLVCVDMFETETAAVSRKAGGVTFLIPAAAHVEKAGSATNSGRTLQWRYQATPPAGNTKDDTELLLRLAKALDTANGFSHIKTVWDNNGVYSASGNVYQKLYADPYGGYVPGTNSFDAVSGVAYMANLNSPATSGQTTYLSGAVVKGSEWVAECIYRESMAPVAVGGTLWIYTGAYNATATWTTDQKHGAAAAGLIAGSTAVAQPVWGTQNRAKSRDRSDGNYQLAYPGWGYAWLVNRRVFYNNGDIPGDVADYFMGPDSVSRMFTSTSTSVQSYSRWYRTIHRLVDKPSPVLAADTSSPHYDGASVSLAGAFPGHTEPYETSRQDLLANNKWGRNTKGTAGNAWDLVKTDTPVAGRGLAGDPAAANYPLTLTTIRCVEHFQGGPITRNNAWNVELEPVPWIELNSTDALAKGINDGDMVKIVTARTEGVNGNSEMDLYGEGFKARVGVGLSTAQRVGPGLVAIPWHWGEKGLSTGSRANDLCIDACDANSVIPESKVCLCRIEKI